MAQRLRTTADRPGDRLLPDESCGNAGNTITIYGSSFPSNPLPTVTINNVAATVLGLSQAVVGGLGQFEAKYMLPLALANAGRLGKFGA